MERFVHRPSLPECLIRLHGLRSSLLHCEEAQTTKYALLSLFLLLVPLVYHN